MTPPTNPKPSEGAMRAAEKIIDTLAPGDHERNVRMAADLIDRETGLGKLIAACEELLAVVSIQNGNLHADTNEIQARAKEALALSKSPNQRGA